MRLQVNFLRFQLSEPFITHKNVTDIAVTQVLVKIYCGQLVGFGVAVPAKEYGYSVDTLFREIESSASLLKEYNNPFQLNSIISQLASKISLAALSAIDMALHDLLGKYLNCPLYKLWGLDTKTLPACAISLGLMSQTSTQKKLVELQASPIIKIKMSQPDEARIALIRKHYHGRLWIDGNGAWSVPEAIASVKIFSEYNIELIEQPVAKNNIVGLKKVLEQTDSLIIADESCATVEDIIKVADSVDGINIKLFKCGGLVNARSMIDVAKAHNLKVMLGCKVESVLSISAMANLSSLADFIDLDGHLDNVNDSFVGVNITNGQLKLSEEPGIGAQFSYLTNVRGCNV